MSFRSCSFRTRKKTTAFDYLYYLRGFLFGKRLLGYFSDTSQHMRGNELHTITNNAGSMAVA